MKLVATAVLWTKLWKTGPETNESIAKDLLKSLITADINSGKTEYTLDEVMDMLELAYGRAGSKNAHSKAKQTWARYAKPSKEGWFVELT